MFHRSGRETFANFPVETLLVGMATIKQFEDLDAWQAARTLANAIYSISSIGKFSHDISLKHQMRRSAISTMSNIAEGFERDGN